jgi:hypothetical protein
MLTLSYHSLDTDYAAFRYDLILNFEQFRSQAYYDSATPRNASIGTGFNVHNNSDVLKAVLDAMGINSDQDFPFAQNPQDQADAQAAEQGYVGRITALFDGPDIGDERLQTQLDRIMEDRAADPALLAVGFFGPTSFAMTEDEAKVGDQGGPSRAIAVFERGDFTMKVGAAGDCDGPWAGESDRS